MDQSIWLWIGFNALVLLLLALDLGLFHRKAHAVSFKEALIWSVVWITLALSFNVFIYFSMGATPAIDYFTGYLIEKSLSVDNIFVFVLLFTYFGVAPAYQHRVLFWGILGALIMRGTLIGVGSVLLEHFHWIIYIFGAFLVFTGIRMGMHNEEEVHPEKNPVLRIAKKFLPITHEYHEDRFFVRQSGKWLATPLLLVLIVVETTDLVFAVDSIPAVFAITRDPFIVYTSNVFAILGLRSLYFVFASIIDKFYYLQTALAIILSYVGIKMLASGFFHIPTWISLLVIAVVLTIAVIASIIRNRKMSPEEKAQEEEEKKREREKLGEQAEHALMSDSKETNEVTEKTPESSKSSSHLS